MPPLEARPFEFCRRAKEEPPIIESITWLAVDALLAAFASGLDRGGHDTRAGGNHDYKTANMSCLRPETNMIVR